SALSIDGHRFTRSWSDESSYAKGYGKLLSRLASIIHTLRSIACSSCRLFHGGTNSTVICFNLPGKGKITYIGKFIAWFSDGNGAHGTSEERWKTREKD